MRTEAPAITGSLTRCSQNALCALGVYYPRGAILPSIGASLRIRTEVDSVQNHVGGIMDNERPFYWREPRRGAM